MGIAPKGYLNFRNENKDATLIADEKTSELIKYAFENYSLGIFSAEEIRKKVVEKGLKISKQGFIKMLKNPVYSGKIAIKAWKKEEAQIVQGLHEAIISEELFIKVQNIFAGKKVPKHSSSFLEIDEEFPLKGFLICECCSKKLTGSFSNGGSGIKHSYYHGNRNCKVRFPSKVINESFVEYLSSFELKPEIANPYKEILKDAFGGEETERIERIKRLEYESSILESRSDSLLQKFLDDSVSKEVYNQNNIKIQKQIANVRMELEEIKSTKDNLTTYIEFGISFLSSVTKFYDSSPTNIKRQIIRSIFIDKLSYSDKKYRTTEMNEFIRLMFATVKGCESKGNKKADRNVGLSKKAPEDVVLSNQFATDLKKLYYLYNDIAEAT